MSKINKTKDKASKKSLVTEDYEYFAESCFSYLASTSNYEIVTSTTEDGEYLEQAHYNYIKNELAKTETVILYTYKVGNLDLVINPLNLKYLVLEDGEYH
jgi:hypothetical protein